MSKTKIIYKDHGRLNKDYVIGSGKLYGTKWQIRYNLHGEITSAKVLDPNWEVDMAKVKQSLEWLEKYIDWHEVWRF